MANTTTKGWLRLSILVSLIVHLLLLLSVLILVPIEPPKNKKPPHLYIPSYVYKGSMRSYHQPRSRPLTAAPRQKVQQMGKNQIEKIADNGLLSRDKKMRVAPSAPASMLAASFQALKNEQFKSLQRVRDDKQKPILLVGDLNQFADPIVKLLAQSLSANFGYPEREGMMGIHGRVIIELVLHPDGHYSQIRMLSSSANQNLDAAALYAVNKAPLVEGAGRFISQPTRFVVGFEFK